MYRFTDAKALSDRWIALADKVLQKAQQIATDANLELDIPYSFRLHHFSNQLIQKGIFPSSPQIAELKELEAERDEANEILRANPMMKAIDEAAEAMMKRPLGNIK
jgi:hypothetical protein